MASGAIPREKLRGGGRDDVLPLNRARDRDECGECAREADDESERARQVPVRKRLKKDRKQFLTMVGKRQSISGPVFARVRASRKSVNS